MMLKKYLELINEKTRTSPIFYISPSIERGIGLEDLLKHYYIIYSNESKLANILEERGINIYKANIKPSASSMDIIKDASVKAFIKTHSPSRPNIMFFRNSSALNKAAEEFNILNPNPQISTNIENKINQYEILRETNIKDILPKSIISRITDVTYNELKNDLGTSFVAQFDIGHAGNSTFFIADEEEFNEFKKSYINTNMKVKFSEELSYNFITINAVATRYGTYCGGLSNQVTGLVELNALKGETCGTNWNQLKITPKIKKEAIEITTKVGDYLYSIGFKGFFGLDLAIHNDHLYLLEINPRQIASIQYFTKIQIENNEIPLSIINLMEFLNIEFNIDKDKYNQTNNEKIEASTLIIRNHFDKSIKINKSFTGIYNVEDIRYEEEGYSFSDLYSKSKVIIIQSPENTIVKPNEEYLKILAKSNIYIDNKKIDKNISKIINTTFSNIEKIED